MDSSGSPDHKHQYECHHASTLLGAATGTSDINMASKNSTDHGDPSRRSSPENESFVISGKGDRAAGQCAPGLSLCKLQAAANHLSDPSKQ
jgi:hypothetical protein